jgi:hypothetical protein
MPDGSANQFCCLGQIFKIGHRKISAAGWNGQGFEDGWISALDRMAVPRPLRFPKVDRINWKIDFRNQTSGLSRGKIGCGFLPRQKRLARPSSDTVRGEFH